MEAYGIDGRNPYISFLDVDYLFADLCAVNLMQSCIERIFQEADQRGGEPELDDPGWEALDHAKEFLILRTIVVLAGELAAGELYDIGDTLNALSHADLYTRMAEFYEWPDVHESANVEILADLSSALSSCVEELRPVLERLRSTRLLRAPRTERE